jgi:hypothetical protein
MADGEKYKGEYVGGVKHGEGEYTWPDGLKEKGRFANGKIRWGEYIWPDGS